MDINSNRVEVDAGYLRHVSEILAVTVTFDVYGNRVVLTMPEVDASSSQEKVKV